MPYRSSEAQLANLKRREPKSGTARDSQISVRLTQTSRDYLRSHLKTHNLTVSDFLEAIAIRLEKGEITIDDLLGK